MNRKFIWLTIGLYLLVLFPRHDGRIVSMFPFELGIIYTAITSDLRDPIVLFSLFHVGFLVVFVIISRKKILSAKEKYILLASITLQALSPIFIALNMGLRQQKAVFLTSIPFWLFALITIYYIARLLGVKTSR